MLGARPAAAQDWPDRPLSLAHGRLTVGGDATLTVGTSDPGYFNFTDYERSTLRLVRFDVVAALRANSHLSCVAELRAEGDSGAGHWNAGAYAAYVRVQPWATRAFEVQAGRIPTAFGGFSTAALRHRQPADRLSAGLSVPDVAPRRRRPATADDLVAMRARGWYAYYPVGADYWDHGVPAMSVFSYDTGVLAKVGLPAARTEISASITAGTLSNPGLGDHNGAPQFAARAARPSPACSSACPARAGHSSSRTSGTCSRPSPPGAPVPAARVRRRRRALARVLAGAHGARDD